MKISIIEESRVSGIRRGNLSPVLDLGCIFIAESAFRVPELIFSATF
jgi:hypothetical protein